MTLNSATLVLVILAAVNQGLDTLFRVNLVNSVLGVVPGLDTAFNLLVGLSGLYVAYNKWFAKKK